jgi:hypothetical protein
MTDGKTKIELDVHALLKVIYVLLALALAFVIGIYELWPYTLFVDFHLDSENMYPSKLVFMETFLASLGALFPVFWVVKKIVPAKINKEQ